MDRFRTAAPTLRQPRSAARRATAFREAPRPQRAIADRISPPTPCPTPFVSHGDAAHWRTTAMAVVRTSYVGVEAHIGPFGGRGGVTAARECSSGPFLSEARRDDAPGRQHRARRSAHPRGALLDPGKSPPHVQKSRIGPSAIGDPGARGRLVQGVWRAADGRPETRRRWGRPHSIGPGIAVCSCLDHDHEGIDREGICS